MKDFSHNQLITYVCAVRGYRPDFLTFFRVLFSPAISGSTGVEYDHAVKMINRMARMAYFNYPHYSEDTLARVQDIVQAVAYFVCKYGPSCRIGNNHATVRNALWASDAWRNKSTQQTLRNEVRAFMAHLWGTPSELFERSGTAQDVRREYTPRPFWLSAAGDYEPAKPAILFNTDLGQFGRRYPNPRATGGSLTPREWWTVYQHTIPKEVKEKVFYALFQHNV